MLDENKKQRIIQLIQGSNILNAQEKTDWLALLDLMNDKQIAELEEILLPKAAEPALQKPTEKTPPQLSQPSLSHISNLPNQFSDQRMSSPAKPRMTPPVTPVRPVIKPPVTPVKSVPVTASAPTAQSKPIPVIKKVEPLVVPKPAVPISPAAVSGQPITFTKPEDVAQTTVAILHQQTRENFYKAITGLASQFGYFQVLHYLEQSALYKEYINYGRIKLSANTSQQLPLSQEEFEFITDLLLALRINRL